MNIQKFLFYSGIRVDKFLASTKILSASTGKSKIIFFPGCSLSGYNPDYVFKVRDYLSEKFDECGILTACCAKPLKLMGDTKTFHKRIESVKKEIDLMNADTVITACQNCYKILKENTKGKNILSLWPVMTEKGLPLELKNKFHGLEASVQYSCSSTPEVVSSVREILNYLGVKVKEIPGKNRKLICCGGIQALTTGDLNFANEYKKKRANEFPCKTIISYCASCRAAMSIDTNHDSIHILDLIFGNGKVSLQKSNLINRLVTARKINQKEK